MGVVSLRLFPSRARTPAYLSANWKIVVVPFACVRTRYVFPAALRVQELQKVELLRGVSFALANTLVAVVVAYVVR